MKTRLLLFCAIASSLWYFAINVIVPPLYPDYSILDLTVSELSALGSPTRGIWVPLAMPYTILFALFGWGVLRAASDKWLTIAGWLIIFYSAFNIYWPPMHMREVLASGGGTLSDTLHLVWAGVTVGLFIVIMLVSAAGMDLRFRIFTGISLAILILFGWLTGQAAPDVGANLPTPLAGLYERINIAVFLVWVTAFAVILLRRASEKMSTQDAQAISF